MDQLLNVLSASWDLPLGIVVVVGAGDGRTLDTARLAALSLQRLDQVEGDPITAAAPERHIGRLDWMNMRATANTAHSGKMRWLPRSLGGFNGPCGCEPLQTCYPRLRRLEDNQLHRSSMTERPDGLDPRPKHVKVFAMDAPGQGDALLAFVPGPALAAFETLAQRGCLKTLPPKGAPVGAPPRLPQVHSFRTLTVDQLSDPLWPLAVMGFDASLHDYQLAWASTRMMQQCQHQTT